MRFVVAIAVAVLALMTVERASAEVRRPPNVVLILADDLGIPDVGAYGFRSAIPTPNIDRIAKMGVRFTRGYASASVCSPSRAGLLTGRYQQRSGFEFLTPSQITPGDMTKGGLQPDQVLLPSYLKQLGYRTAAVGKWHLGVTPDRLPTARGFDTFFGFLPGEDAYIEAGTPGSVTVPLPYVGDRSTHRRTELQQVGRWHAGSDVKQTVLNGNRYLTEELTSEAVKIIEDKRSNQPFFLYLAYNAPHSPFQATQKYLNRFPNEKDPLKRTYAAMISALDDGVGEVLDALKKAGVDKNTIVIFASDNGAATYFGVSDCSTLSGGKLSYFEGGARVPFIIDWPGHVAPGTVETRNVSLLDIVPTVLDAAGATAPAGLDGADLRQALQSKSQTIHETLFWRTGHEFAALNGNWKMLSNTRPGAAAWLFDLGGDPSEKKDLAYARSDILHDIEDRYKKWQATLKEPAWASQKVVQFFQCGRISFQDQ